MNLIKRVLRFAFGRFQDMLTECRVRECRARYPRAVKRIRRKWRDGERIRVVFFVTEAAKWKTQSLCDVMAKDDRFEIVVAVSRPDRYFCLGKEELKREFEECCDFFERKGRHVERVYDPSSQKFTKLCSLSPDIVFYQQPWLMAKGQMPSDVADRAITCYVPYFVPNYGDLDIDIRKPFHRMVYLHFILNESWVNVYSPELKRKAYAGRLMGLGHTMLDGIRFEPDHENGKGCVIYAPHASINPKHDPKLLSHGTFLWNGKAILEYAKAHPEIKWIFKPHPNLKGVLSLFKVMTPAEAQAYYDEWAKIGRVATSGDYAELFNESTALITDCGSFLTEYAVTGKPIIHLISKFNTHIPMASSYELYKTYYRVNDLEEMYDTFRTVLEEKKDPLREKRHEMLATNGLINSHAGERIFTYLKSEVLGL